MGFQSMEASNAPPFLLLPNELILSILSHLDVDEVLAMRQTCKRLCHITEDRALWLQLLIRQHATLPLSHHLMHLIESDYSSLLGLPYTALEPEVRSAHRIAQSWTQPRLDRPVKLEPKSATSLLGFEVFLDRWLITAYAEGVVCLWDIDPPKSENTATSTTDEPFRWDTMELETGGFTSFTAALDSSEQFIIFALTRASIPPSTELFTVSMDVPNPFVHVLSKQNMSPQTIRTIEPKLRLFISNDHNRTEVSQWYFSDGGVTTRSVIVESLLGDVWNGILDIRVIGPFVVIFRAHNLELHSFVDVVHPSGDPMHPYSYFEHIFFQFHDLPVMIYSFPPSLTFRYISCTDYIVMEPDNPHSELIFEFIAYDALKGTFRFVASIGFATNPSGQTDSSIDVRCLGVSALANNLDLKAIFPYFPFQPTIRSTLSAYVESRSGAAASPPPQDTPTPTPTIGISHTGIFGREPAARGFVSAMALGPQGRRAAWVERTRGSTLREVRVWNKEPEGEDDYETRGVDMPTHVVYSVGSYDLRDDITHCAIAEASGKIILGNRAGDVFILGLNK